MRKMSKASKCGGCEVCVQAAKKSFIAFRKIIIMVLWKMHKTDAKYRRERRHSYQWYELTVWTVCDNLMKDFGKLGNFPCNNEISYELRCFRNKEAIYEKEQKADCGGVHDSSHGTDISPNMAVGWCVCYYS